MSHQQKHRPPAFKQREKHSQSNDEEPALEEQYEEYLGTLDCTCQAISLEEFKARKSLGLDI